MAPPIKNEQRELYNIKYTQEGKYKRIENKIKMKQE